VFHHRLIGHGAISRKFTDANPDGGLVENINVVGETVEVVGWARLRDDETLTEYRFLCSGLTGQTIARFH